MNKQRQPTHPGAVLREDVLPNLTLSNGEFARRTGLSRQEMHDLLAEKTGITPETAFKISEAYGSSPAFWLGMQKNYDLYQAGQQKCDCTDKSQCWEQCGDLGHSEKHTEPYERDMIKIVLDYNPNDGHIYDEKENLIARTSADLSDHSLSSYLETQRVTDTTDQNKKEPTNIQGQLLETIEVNHMSVDTVLKLYDGGLNISEIIALDAAGVLK